MTKVFDDAELLRQLTGLSPARFARLHEAFARVWEKEHGERTVRGRRRQRERGAGLKGSLRDTRAMLVFILFYHRWQPTQKALGSLFGMTQQWANLWLNHLTPLLEKAMGAAIRRPDRKPSNLSALLAAVPSAIALAQDANLSVARPPPLARA